MHVSLKKLSSENEFLIKKKEASVELLKAVDATNFQQLLMVSCIEKKTFCWFFNV